MDVVLLQSDVNLVYFTGCFRSSGERTRIILYVTLLVLLHLCGLPYHHNLLLLIKPNPIPWLCLQYNACHEIQHSPI